MENIEGKFKYLDHTADVKFQAFGKTLEEAFSNAILASINVITDVEKVEAKKEIKIDISSKKKESLLYDLLNEIVFLIDTENFIVGKVEDMKIKKSSEGYELTATLMGDDLKNYKTTGDIKSATYNFMFIEEKENNVIIQAVLDL